MGISDKKLLTRVRDLEASPGGGAHADSHAPSASDSLEQYFAQTIHTHDLDDTTGLSTYFAPSVHTHVLSDTTGLSTYFAPSIHTHVLADTTGLTTYFAPSAHNHVQSDVTGLTGYYQSSTADLTQSRITGLTGYYAPSSTPITRTATVTLTNDEIKALPTTGILIVSAAGANILIKPTVGCFVLDTSAGAYTNVHIDSIFSLNINTFSILSDMEGKNIFDGAATKWILIGGAPGGWDTHSNLTNTDMVVKMNNAGSGNLTGGNAANTLLCKCE